MSRPYTDEDLDFIRQHKDWSCVQLGMALGRTAIAIQAAKQRHFIPRRVWRATECRICGKPRYPAVRVALCEDHYLEDMRKRGKKSYAKRTMETV